MNINLDKLKPIYANTAGDGFAHRIVIGDDGYPTCEYMDADGNILVGETAREYGYLHPDRTAKVFKRSMGTDGQYELADMKFGSRCFLKI